MGAFELLQANLEAQKILNVLCRSYWRRAVPELCRLQREDEAVVLMGQRWKMISDVSGVELNMKARNCRCAWDKIVG